jgi:hypothetical protein
MDDEQATAHRQQRIVAILRREYEKANEAYRHAHAEHMGAVASANAWDQCNPEDGVGAFGRNPYNIDAASKRDTDARVYAADMRDAYEHAVDTFVEKLSAPACLPDITIADFIEDLRRYPQGATVTNVHGAHCDGDPQQAKKVRIV